MASSSSETPLYELHDGLLAEYGNLTKPEGLDDTIRELHDNLKPCIGIHAARELLRLAAAYQAKCWRTRALEDYQASAMLLIESINAIPDDRPDKVEMLHRSAKAFFKLFELTKSMEDLAIVKQQLHAMLGMFHGDEEGQAMIFQELAVAGQSEFDITKQISAINDTIRCLESCLKLTPKANTEWLRRSLLLTNAAQAKYKTTGEAQDVMSAIKYWEPTLEVVPEGSSSRIWALGLLGAQYSDLCEVTKDSTLLDKVIDIFEEILLLCPKDQPERHLAMLEQGKAYIAKSELTSEMAFLEVGARQIKHTFDCIPKNSPIRERFLPYAAEKWYNLYRLTKGRESLETSMTLFEEVLSFLPNNFSLRRDILIKLSDLAVEKCLESRDAEDITAASRRLEVLRTNLPNNDPDRQRIEIQLMEVVFTENLVLGPPPNAPSLPIGGLSSRSGATIRPNTESDVHWARLFRISFDKEVSGDLTDLEERIQDLEHALQQLPPNHWLQVIELGHLGTTYLNLYKETELIHHLDRAIKYFREGLDLGVSHERPRQLLLTEFSNATWLRYDATGLDEDLDTAIEAAQNSLNEYIRPRHDLIRLGSLLGERYWSTGDPADLDQSLDIHQRILALTTADDRDSRPAALHDIGVIYTLRAERTFALSDVMEATKFFEQALDACSEQDPRRSKYLSQLAHTYCTRAIRASDPKYLDMAIERYLESVKASNDIAKEGARCWSFVARGYLIKFDHTDLISDLTLAIDNFEKALQLVSENQENLRQYILFTLGTALMHRYRHTEDMKSWERAISYMQDSLGTASKALSYRAIHLWKLGQGYYLRFEKTRDIEYLHKAIPPLEGAIRCGIPLQRFPPGKDLFYIYTFLEDWPSAYRIAVEVFSLMPLIMSRSLENSDKQWHLTELVGFASDATAAALEAGESPFAALKLLETGRGVIMGSVLGLRSDIDDLQQHHPKLAQEYLMYRDRIDSTKGAVSNPSAAWLPDQRPDYRHDANRELERVIASIRRLPGFENFLQEPSEEDIKTAATLRPVVVINVSRYRCDAIIVKSDGISVRSLPDITMEKIKDVSQAITGVRSLESKVLEWLWDNIVEPVLDTLNFTALPDEGDWPQICWVPTGPLVRLPLHAAGYHESSGNKTVLDRVVSSYSISLTALVQMHAYRQKPEAERKPQLAVAIGMPELPNALNEVREMARICQSIQVQMPKPYTKEVLKTLKDCDMFHFAGHGSSSPLDPLKSALILKDSDRLTVSDLFDINLHKRRPFLAYLSACSTGQIRDDTYVDEGLHLIAACQVAGFQHVIGTLWEVSDDLCVEAARRTYEWLERKGISHESVSEGLHRTCRKLREAWVRDVETRRAKHRAVVSETYGEELRDIQDIQAGPLLWVPYVHYGL